MPAEGKNIKDYLVSKYGPGALKNFGDKDSYLYRSGREVGIHFNSDRNIYPTDKAHALMEHVKDQENNDKGNQLMEILFQKYFVEGENINSVEVLKGVATQVLESEEKVDGAVEAMQTPALLQLVKAKDQEFKTRMRVNGVPFFILDSSNAERRPIAFSGAQPADVIAEQLQAVAEEE